MKILNDLRALHARLDRACIKIKEAIDEINFDETVLKIEDSKVKVSLTDKEKEILRMLKEGLDTHAIAKEMAISKKTVEVRRDTIRHKFGIASSRELLVMLKNGMIF